MTKRQKPKTRGDVHRRVGTLGFRCSSPASVSFELTGTTAVLAGRSTMSRPAHAIPECELTAATDVAKARGARPLTEVRKGDSTMGSNFFLDQSLPAIGLEILVLFVLVNAVGHRIGWRVSKADGAEKRERTAGTVTGAMLALLGFVLAVSLSMADSHFGVRRKLVLDEANALGTSRLRVITLGGPHALEISRLLRDYTELRLEFFAAGDDTTRLKLVDEQTSNLQRRIWDHASAIATAAPTPISGLLLSSLNEVFDLATTRRWALEVRVPPYVVNLLVVLAVLTMALLGYYFGVCGVRFQVLSAILFVAFTVAILLVMDLNRPRGGFIQAEQSPLIWLMDDMSRDSPASSAAK